MSDAGHDAHTTARNVVSAGETTSAASRLGVTELAVGIAGRRFCEQLDFAIAPGECAVIVGPNGAGKTTLLAALAGLRAPSHGRIAYNGQPIEGLDPRQRARQRAWLPQYDHDAFPATVLETVLVGRHPHVKPWRWESAHDMATARAALASVDLGGLESREVATLSGGERRRVAIACVLAQDAPLLLLDEPTAHLDLRHQIAILDLLASYKRERGAALVLVLHDLHLALRYADTAIAIGHGRACFGAATEVLTASRMSELFDQPLVSVGDALHRTLLPA